MSGGIEVSSVCLSVCWLALEELDGSDDEVCNIIEREILSEARLS